MNMDDQDQIARLEKIRALLAKAEGTKFPEEAKLFTAKAQELMAKWAIDDAMLHAGKEDKGQIAGSIIWLDANEYRAPKVRLLANLAVVNSCRCLTYTQEYVIHEGKRKRRFRCEIFGFEQDRKNVEILYTSLMLQAEQELLSEPVMARMQAECSQGGHSIKWRNSFMMAYANALHWRMVSAKERAHSEYQQERKVSADTMAMVLVSRQALVTRQFEEAHPKLRSAGRSSAGQGMGSAGALGHAAGNKADIGQPKVGTRKGGLLS